MKKVLILLLVCAAIAMTTAKDYTFKFSEAEAGLIIQSLQRNDRLSAKESNDLIEKIQHQAADSTLNKQK